SASSNAIDQRSPLSTVRDDGAYLHVDPGRNVRGLQPRLHPARMGTDSAAAQLGARGLPDSRVRADVRDGRWLSRGAAVLVDAARWARRRASELLARPVRAALAHAC